MFVWFYNAIQILIALAFLPRLLKSSFRSSVFSYLGFRLPPRRTTKERCFLFYAVSVGETKAARPLFDKMKSQYPDASFYIASRTKMGHEEAKRSLLDAAYYFFLPIDFSWVMKNLIRRINPTMVIVIESDLWFNFLNEAKKSGILTVLVNARISDRSYTRFRLVPAISRKLFSLFDFIFAQNALFQKRFVELGVDFSKVFASGNLKEEIIHQTLSLEEKILLKDKMGFQKEDFVLVLASTHGPEEKAFLTLLKPLFLSMPSLKVLLVPRHPERVDVVESVLRDLHVSYALYSSIASKSGLESVVLVDAVGLLVDLYQIADLAVVCGSFYPSLKGHNILEPIQVGASVFFGPYMSDQVDFLDKVVLYEAGKQTSLESFLIDFQWFIANKSVFKPGVDRLLLSLQTPSRSIINLFNEFVGKI